MRRLRNLVRISIPAAAAIGVLVAASAAQADCRLSVSVPQDRWTIRHDPFVTDVAQQQFDVTLENQGDTPCEGTIAVRLNGESFGLARTGEAERLPYTLVDERNGADVTPRSGASARRLSARSVSIAPGERQIVSLSMVVVPQTAVGDGDYQQDLVLEVASPEGAPLAERPVTLALSIPPAAVMGLKGAFQRTSGGARIDLGELTEGRRSLSTALYIASTGSYSVTVSSDNAGQLRLGTSSDWAIPYALLFGTREVNLAQGDEIRVNSRLPRLDSYPLSISIGDPSNKRAGDYSDTIRLTVAPF